MHQASMGGAGGLTLAAILAATPLSAAAQSAQISFDIPAGSLAAALSAFARQSGEQLLYDAALATGQVSPGVKGRLSADEALRRLLGEAPIVSERQGRKVIILKPAPAARPDGKLALGLQLQPAEVEAITVTGTLIRGAGEGPSPVLVLGREALDRSGYATLAEALSALPQNFAGSATPESGLTLADPTGTNSYYSSGVNLRGLGADATLVLINGKRLAGSGFKGDFADLSAIPTAAIDRVEVLLDGASALYGSDAVGGVVNVILRRDFSGAETRARAGAAKGGAEELQLAQTFGRRWSSGGLMVSYEGYRRNALANADRPFTASADLRRFGGADLRTRFGHPGNVVINDPVRGPVVGWAIPPGQNGVGLRPGDFLAGQVNPGEPSEGADLLPKTEKHSLFAAIDQQLGDRLRLNADLRLSRRLFAYDAAPPVATLTVNRGNPFFVAPNGASSLQIAYSFYDEIGSQEGKGRAENLGASLGGELELKGDWRAEGYVAFGQETGRSSATNLINTAFLREALGAVADDPATAYVAARDGYFNPFGDGGANGQRVLDFIRSGYTHTYFRTRVASANLVADGELLELAGGSMKLALGVHARRESFLYRSRTLRTSALVGGRVQPTYAREVLAAFAEMRAPLVSPSNARLGVQRLELSAAVRHEAFDDFGSTTNPKLGLIWEPSERLRLRASFGRSFRAPALSELADPFSISAAYLPTLQGQTLSLYLTGGNPDLKPETATTWTIGGEYRPSWIEGLKLSATWFDIDYRDRIDQPVIFGLSEALTNPIYAAFVDRVDPARPEDRARIEALLAHPRYLQPGAFPPEAFGAIIEARFVNAPAMRVRGLDLAADYGREFGGGRLDLSANLSWLDRYARRITEDAPLVSALDLAGNPVDLRGRGVVRWTSGPVSLSAALNYVDDYRSLTGVKVSAWRTVDLQLSWDGRAPSGPLKGLALTASVQNLFDENPPFFNPPAPATVGYDPANASALGRVVSLQLTKSW